MMIPLYSQDQEGLYIASYQFLENENSDKIPLVCVLTQLYIHDIISSNLKTVIGKTI